VIKFSSSIRLTRLHALQKAVGNTTPVAKRVAETFERQLKRNIIIQGMWGRRWPRAAPNTIVKHRFKGKPAPLLRGLMDRIYSSHGATQATWGFKSAYAEMHHEGRDFSWPISARNKKILFFPVAGQIVKKGRGGTYYRRRSVEGSASEPLGRKLGVMRPRLVKAIKEMRYERFNMVRAKRVIHPGFQSRELMPPPDVVRKTTMAIVDEHIKRA